MRLELTHFKTECRLLSVLLAISLQFNMIEPSLLMLHEPDSLVWAVAGLSGGRTILALAFLGFALLMVPYVTMQIVDPNTRHRPRIIRIACAALCLGGVLWVYLAFLSRNLDYDTITGIFCRNGIWNIGMAAVLAYHLNNKQIRESVKAGAA